MDIKFEKESKLSNDLSVGDNIKVGGLLCKITKIEDIFHYVPNSRIRISLIILGETGKKETVVLFLPNGTPINVLK